MSNHKLGSPVRPPAPPVRGTLHHDDDCQLCGHAAWAHRRVEQPVWDACVFCGCHVLAR